MYQTHDTAFAAWLELEKKRAVIPGVRNKKGQSKMKILHLTEEEAAVLWTEYTGTCCYQHEMVKRQLIARIPRE